MTHREALQAEARVAGAKSPSHRLLLRTLLQALAGRLLQGRHQLAENHRLGAENGGNTELKQQARIADRVCLGRWVGGCLSEAVADMLVADGHVQNNLLS